MQIRKMTLMFTVLGAMSMVLTACGDGGRDSLTCTEGGAECIDGEICHPTAKVCVQTCTTGGDCPESAKTCAAIGNGNTQMICQCSTDALCQRDERVTDASTLKCSIPTGATTGVCAPAGTTPVETTCNPANQPGTCSYGQICSSTTTKCEAAPVGTCSQATGAPAWNQSGGAAPVIVSATAEFVTSTNAANECGGGASAAIVTINYYAPGGLTTHTSTSDLQNHVKFRTATSFFGVAFSRQDPPAGTTATQGTMKVGISCDAPTRREAAIYIANEQGQTSNVVCVSW
ncbi:MAG TPA: hypothetical protein VF794_10000 [Archangium sp.]|jgi:hypothetical protein|uniref:hypothetical protein n=1 Tax=Archangium sp. TaxID=1872627 RepID=UPI002ED8B9EF